MNHSTFHKAMNFIKLNQCKFGYIGKTNIELVEQELIEIIIKYGEEGKGNDEAEDENILITGVSITTKLFIN